MNKLETEIEKYCRFCNPPDKDRILFETQNFYVMLSLGPIKEGYLLIISKEHIECCGAIPDSLGAEFDKLVSSVKSILKEEYGACILYEHGRAGSCLSYGEGSKHCYHAHLHCVPININLNKLIKGALKPIDFNSFEEFRKTFKSTNEPYLFVDDGKMQMHIAVNDLRRQYLRFLASNEIGETELWDWVKFQGWDKIESAKKKLKPRFEKLATEYVS